MTVLDSVWRGMIDIANVRVGEAEGEGRKLRGPLDPAIGPVKKRIPGAEGCECLRRSASLLSLVKRSGYT